ncbi:hypothetical protein U1Q18_022852, partial [Sarracenia purpurea var. burkii]
TKQIVLFRNTAKRASRKRQKNQCFREQGCATRKKEKRERRTTSPPPTATNAAISAGKERRRERESSGERVAETEEHRASDAASFRSGLGIRFELFSSDFLIEGIIRGPLYTSTDFV